MVSAADSLSPRVLSRVLEDLVEGTRSVAGTDFMRSLVRSLARTLGARFVMLGRVADPEFTRVATLAVWSGDAFAENFEYSLAGAPCKAVIGGSMCFVAQNVAALYPQDAGLSRMLAESYLGVPMFTAEGRPLGLLVVVDDKPMVQTAEVTALMTLFSARAAAELERLEATRALLESEELFRQLAAHIPQALWIRELETETIRYVNPGWEKVTGRSLAAGDAVEKLFDAIHPEERPWVLRDTRMLSSGGFDRDVRVIRPDAQARWVHLRTFPIADSAGRTVRMAGIMEDITERKDAEDRLQRLAHYDTLTGLPNRAHYYESLERALAQAERNRWMVSVLFVDLDGFKTVNDSLGHAVGDQLLRQVAARLVKCLRVRDVVGRLGGDEFALMLFTPDGAQGAGTVADKVREALRQPFELEGHQVVVAASIGIAVYPGDSSDAGTLIKYADTAMYRAKEAGRDTYRFYTAEMNARALERLDLENALRKALDRGEFVLHYQPKMRIDDGQWTGVEALLRWNRPGHGLVSPAVFVPVLEKTGLIVPVGKWVIDAACRQIAEWKRSALDSVSVAVNLSGEQFLRPAFKAEVARAAEEHGVATELLEFEVEAARSLRAYSVDPGMLEFELTESALMSHSQGNIAALRRLKDLGIAIAVDDFGTGYSSLAYLKRFPVDKVKIDIAFIRDVTTNPDDAAITLAIIGMAHSLKLKVIAEGVETREQLEFLRANGCDEMQGYYLSRPLPPAELERFYRETRLGAVKAAR